MNIVNNLKENDLLLLSTVKLSDVKSLFNTENKSWKEIQDSFDPNKGLILWIVDKKFSKSEPRIPLKVSSNNSHKICSQWKSMANLKNDFYWYMITSLSTMIREYRAIKWIEFSNFSNIIMNPSVITKNFYDIVNNHKTKDLYKVFWENNKKYFNISQLNALKYVAKFSEWGVSLIQGPPGTGKTHTIQGLISMAYAWSSRDSEEKILVWTPSNAAWDEIVYRLAK